jgi:hypothetical protein
MHSNSARIVMISVCAFFMLISITGSDVVIAGAFADSVSSQLAGRVSAVTSFGWTRNLYPCRVAEQDTATKNIRRSVSHSR